MFCWLKNLVLFFMILGALSACASVHNARTVQELHRGKNNFEAGLYRDAFHQLLPLATEGNKEAEYAVGYMYYYGYGVSQDTDSGTFWIRKSAEQHYSPAIQALEAIKKAE